MQVKDGKIEVVFYGLAEGGFAMKKRLVALMAAVCLAVVPVSVLAEETDYSYLEDMSVKELKELRDAINEILGDGESSETTSTETEYKDEYGNKLSIDKEPYKHVIEKIQAFKEDLYNPYSLELYHVTYDSATDVVSLDCSYTDESGISLRKGISLMFTRDDGSVYVGDGMFPGGSSLNVDFIAANLENK